MLSCNYHISALWHIHLWLMLESTKMVVLSIVAACLDYCNSLLYSSDNLRKLQVTQNALARVVCQTARSCSATEKCHTLHWLPLKQRIGYKLAVSTHNVTQSVSPSYVASLISDYAPSRSLRSLDKQLLSRPYTSLVTTDKAFSVSAPKMWNDLPDVLQLVWSFKRNLKCELLSSAYADHSQ